MKVSYRWLKDYVNIDVPFPEFCERMTMSGTKVEEAYKAVGDIKGVVVGKILTITKHPDADRLVVCQVDIGDRVLQIVTGAPNVAVSCYVPVATVGAELFGGIKIKQSKLRGVESQGMLCSLAELGLDNNYYVGAEADGIYIIDEKRYHAEPGDDVIAALDLQDEIVDFEITPNRADCLSVEGIAREVAATFNLPYNPPEYETVTTKAYKVTDDLKVTIESPDNCSRFMSATIHNVKIAPSPEWLCQRLRASGVRPINNIVDITNYVMLATGHPLHAYDYKDIVGHHIVVRQAFAKEKITTLDGTEHELDTKHLLIASPKENIGLAGIMGGLNTEIHDDTCTVVLESAAFSRQAVHYGVKTLGIRTEASLRFERYLPEQTCENAIKMALGLVSVLKAGDIAEGIIDVGAKNYPLNKTVVFAPERIRKFLGVELQDKEIISYLNRCFIATTQLDAEKWQATIPYFRLGDMKGVADLAEEVARIYGYNNIKPNYAATASMTLGLKTPRQKLIQSLDETLRGLGFNQVVTSSLESVDISEKFLLEKPQDQILIRNPLGEQFARMRTVASSELLKIASNNYAHGTLAGMIYEINKTYHQPFMRDERSTVLPKLQKRTDELPDDNLLPVVNPHVVMLCWEQDAKHDTGKLFFQLKGAIDVLLKTCGIKEAKVKFIRNQSLPYLHAGQSASLYIDEVLCGSFGVAAPQLLKNVALDTGVVLADLALEILLSHADTDIKVKAVPKFPPLTRDLAVVSDRNSTNQEVVELIRQNGGPYLDQIALFDIYESAKLGANKISRAYALSFVSLDKSLTDAEINLVIDRIVKALAAAGHELRSL